MKRIILLFAILFCCQQSDAQQIFQLTQYMTNNFAYNPAVAGSSDKFNAKFTFRKQWAGLEDAPSTAMLSVQGNLLENRAVGLGAIFYSDVTGPTRRTGAQLAYAYQIPLGIGVTHLGIGVAGSLLQYKVNFTDLVLQHDDDPQIASGDMSKIGGDAHLGAYLTNDDGDFWFGVSVNQLLASKFTFAGDSENIENARHIYVTGGYGVQVSETFNLQPGILMKLVEANSPQFEINAKATYTAGDNDYWLGLAYRTEDAIAALLGLNLGNGFNLAYAYDLTTSELNNVSNGSHEITLGFDFSIFDGE